MNIHICKNTSCSKEFTAKRRDAIYCSGKCRDALRPPRKRSEKDLTRGRERYARLKQDPVWIERQREKDRNRSRALKEWIGQYKTSKGCIDCGYSDNPVALDIDHIEGKTRNIASLKSIPAVLAEIERHRCVVRCANCHRIKSHETKTWVRI